ncbi:MAG: CHASE2 domain-containing protein [Bacteroidales bacterium]|nr:CHASE2 domain-containing protein [Bacteroidales bacterium]
MAKKRRKFKQVKKGIKNILKKIHAFLNILLPSFTPKTLILSSLHAIWMIIFSLFWLINIYYFDGFGFMNDIYDYKEFIQDYVDTREFKTDINDKYLLIDVSENSQLLNTGVPPLDYLTNEVIADREQLTSTLTFLDENSDQIKYVICDVWLDKKFQPQIDSALQAVITNLNNKNKLVLSTLVVEDTVLHKQPLVFESKNGAAQYRSSFLNQEFLKFSYYFEGHKQVPLVAYESITGDSIIERSFLGTPYYRYKSGGICLNTMIPPFRYSSKDIIEYETVMPMGFFNLSPEAYLKPNQIVIIGDFTGSRGDSHHTIADHVTGPVILINALESLFNRDNVIGLPLLITLMLFFIIISYHSFYSERIKLFVQNTGIKNKIILLLLKNINYISILILTIICMLVFHFYINLFILISYFAIAEFLIKAFHYFKHKKTKSI